MATRFSVNMRQRIQIYEQLKLVLEPRGDGAFKFAENAPTRRSPRRAGLTRLVLSSARGSKCSAGCTSRRRARSRSAWRRSRRCWAFVRRVAEGRRGFCYVREN